MNILVIGGTRFIGSHSFWDIERATTRDERYFK